MTEVLGETDVDWLTLIDYELEKPCETKRGCDKVAEWRFILKCCGGSIFFCTQHKEFEVQWVIRHSGQVVNCLKCQHRFPLGVLITDIYNILPI